MPRLVLPCFALAAITFGSIAGAAQAKTYKDERSTGSPYGSKIDAISDIASLSAEKDGSSIDVVIKKRAGAPADSGGSLIVHINTVGGPTSDPEFVVNGESVSRAGSGEQAGKAKVTRGDGGKTIGFSIPIKALSSPASVAIQVESGGEGAVDIAPGGDFFGRNPEVEKNRRYLKVFTADRIISGSVDIDCEGATTCKRTSLANAGVKAVGGSPRKTYEGVTDDQGAFEFGVEKGTYSVRAMSENFIIKTRPQSANLTKKKKARADFKACGQKAPALAIMSALPATTLKGSDCTNKVALTWTPPNTLAVKWESILVCGGKTYDTPWRKLEQAVVPSTTPGGTRIVVSSDKVEFFAPGRKSGNSMSGTLLASSGTFSGTVASSEKPYPNKSADVPCFYSTRNLALKR